MLSPASSTFRPLPQTHRPAQARSGIRLVVYSLFPFPRVLARAGLKEGNTCLTNIVVKVVFENGVGIVGGPFSYNGLHLFRDWLVICNEEAISKQRIHSKNSTHSRIRDLVPILNSCSGAWPGSPRGKMRQQVVAAVEDCCWGADCPNKLDPNGPVCGCV